MIQQLLHIIFFILFIYFAAYTVYFFVVAIIGKLSRPKQYQPNAAKKSIAVLIPSYKEDHIIINTARKAAAHDYPTDQFTVYIAADRLQPETVAELRTIPHVEVLEVHFELGSKARSLNKLFNWIPAGRHEVAIILDADNVMMPGCLEKVNDAFQHGFRAVQCHRMAKNLNTPVAVLDAISEETNNHLFRRGQRALGFSSTTIGSGMAFEFHKIKEIYDNPDILGNPACDRVVDFEMMKADICIEFIEDAYVLDEKVGNKNVFENQRTRWLESQIIHLRLFFDKKTGYLPKTKDFWNKLFCNLAAPRSIFLVSHVLVFALFVIEYLSGFSILSPAYIWWFGLLITYLLTFIIAIPGNFYSMQTVRAIAHIPLMLWSIVRALFKMKVDRKEFVHTPKEFTQHN
ncbi:glycosyltransferase [Paraflavitalea soli]|uniref:Glycosyltransferase n=1 Tax=Paraflavitalea soli TaxID=2315862 RepID=A0A3B7MSK4_9BACT|nr:glycosyltransferase family 2 protein [Paraflavitalea soli]AXY77524.1 glycosyltransferase [Paraflavitalea soli]